MTDEPEEGQELAPEPPAAKPKKTAKQEATAYLILTLDGDQALAWETHGPVTARSAEQAVREYAKAAELTDAVTLVAIPARSWRPVKVTAKVTTSLVIEEAS